MALDEPKKQDKISEEKGYTFCINPDLLEQVGAVTVSFSHIGFAVEALKPLAAGGSGCNSCAVSGGCGTAGN